MNDFFDFILFFCNYYFLFFVNLKQIYDIINQKKIIIKYLICIVIYVIMKFEFYIIKVLTFFIFMILYLKRNNKNGKKNIKQNK